MKIIFSKIRGPGGLFLIVDAVSQKIFLPEEKICMLKARKDIADFNQLILLEPPYDPDVDFHCTAFNSSGVQEDVMLGGLVSAAKFAVMNCLTGLYRLRISSQCGTDKFIYIKENNIKVFLGVPEFEPSKLGFRASHREKTYIILGANNRTLLVSVVGIGGFVFCITESAELSEENIAAVSLTIKSSGRFQNSPIVCLVHYNNDNEGEFKTNGNLSISAAAVLISSVMHTRLNSYATLRSGDFSIKLSWLNEKNSVVLYGVCNCLGNSAINV